MKLNILYVLGVVTTLLVASCAQEELHKTDTEKLSELSVSVTDGGYISEETVSDVSTRITDNDYRTEFTSGDACGLYIVRDGKIIAENIKLTASGTDDITWSTDAGVKLFGGLMDEDYYLYYPYQESMNGKIVPAATTDADFFAPLINDWQPQADQSNYETGYAASDLMTAEGTSTKNADGTISVSFSMTHRMAMAVVQQMPELQYIFKNELNNGYIIPNYKEFPYVKFYGNIMPYRLSDGVYRYIFNPQQTGTVIDGCYNADGTDKGFTINLQNIDAGRYKTFYVKSSSLRTVYYELSVGDYFCKNSETNDWYIIPKYSKPNENDFVGVVFYVGHNPADDTDYSNTGIGNAECNGYVFAVKDLEEAKWRTSNVISASASTDTQKWDGYNNQQKLAEIGLDDYPAAKACAEYLPAAPQNTSGWFLPSIDQMVSIFDNYDKFIQSVQSFNANYFGVFYWSSTTTGWSADYAETRPNKEQNYNIVSGSKDNEYYVCPVLAF